MRAVSEMRLARLCFAPSVGQQIDAEGWTTVFTLAGLTLPDTSTNRDDYSYEQRLSVALLYLVSQFARKLLNGIDRTKPKAIFLDEAWAITSTPEGAKLVPEVSRMGRSRNTALILVSQNAGDLLHEQVTNCLSSVFAFRSTERGEVANVMSLLGVAPSDEHKAVLRALGNGECIFRDLDAEGVRAATIASAIEINRPVNLTKALRALDRCGGVVREARFLCRGCTASIASASVLTEKMKGRGVSELKEMNAAEIAAELGGLPPASFHAAQLAEDGVRAILAKM